MIRREYPSPNLHQSRGNAGTRSTISCFSQATTIMDSSVYQNNARVALSRTRRCLFWEQGWLRMDSISWQGEGKKAIYIYLAYVTNRAVGCPSTKTHHSFSLSPFTDLFPSTFHPVQSYDSQESESPKLFDASSLYQQHSWLLVKATLFDQLYQHPCFERLSATYISL